MRHQEKLAQKDLDHDRSEANAPLASVVGAVNIGEKEREPRNAKTVKFQMPTESTTHIEPVRHTGDDIRSDTDVSTFRPTSSFIARETRNDSQPVGAKSTTTFVANDEDNYPKPPVKKVGGPNPKCDCCSRRLEEAELGKRGWR